MPETNTMNISKDDLQEMLRTLIKAAKEPTEAQAKEIQEKQDRWNKGLKQAAQQLEMERKSKEQRQRLCTHHKENGKWATGGQIIGGRFGMIICQHCQRPWFAKLSQDVINQINSGDLSLFAADPSGWQDVPPMEEELAEVLA